jgi:hypothetical protein
VSENECSGRLEGSSAGAEAAAEARSAEGPGEHRHLTPPIVRYAQGCWWGGAFNPHRLPRGERGVWGSAPQLNRREACCCVHTTAYSADQSGLADLSLAGPQIA